MNDKLVIRLIPALVVSADDTNSNVEQMDAVHRIASGADLLKDSDELVPLDMEGNPLRKNQRYRFRGEICLVTHEMFGCGNIMDRYYRVFFLDSELKERFTVVDVKYSKDFGPSYPSKFEPINNTNKEN